MAMQPAIAPQNGRGVWVYNQLSATGSQISSLQRQTPFFAPGASCFHYLTKPTFCWFMSLQTVVLKIKAVRLYCVHLITPNCDLLLIHNSQITSCRPVKESQRARCGRGPYNAQVWSTVNADSKCTLVYFWRTDVLQALALFLTWRKNGFSHHYKRCNIQYSQSNGCCVVYTVQGKSCQSKCKKFENKTTSKEWHQRDCYSKFQYIQQFTKYSKYLYVGSDVTENSHDAKGITVINCKGNHTGWYTVNNWKLQKCLKG